MKIFFVSPFLPYPPVAGGHAQVWAWLHRLARKHELAFAGFYERESDRVGLAELTRHCVEVRARLRKPAPHAYSSFAQLPRWVTEFYAHELARDISELATSFQPQVVQFITPNMAQYRRFLSGIPTIVTALEIAFVAYRRRLAAERGITRLQARLDWLRMLRYETTVFRQADHIVAMSEHDRAIISAVAPRTRATAIPPGVDLERFSSHARNPIPGRVLYLGHMEHLPNLDGLVFLYHEIWPLVRRAYPEAKLAVVGGETREELARLAPVTLGEIDRDSSVELLGFVLDLSAYLDTSAVMAAPLRLGSGVRNKVIEAMAAGLPVVTTSRGAEGLAVAHERELLIVENPQDFADQLVRLLRDKELQSRITSAGRELVAREHDNDELAKRLERVLIEASVTGGNSMDFAQYAQLVSAGGKRS